MVRSERSRSLHARGRATLFLLAIGVTLSIIGLVGQHSPTDLAAAEALDPDECAGDETITFAPPEPLAGEEVLVAVTSSAAHRGVWLASSERVVFLREYDGQLGRVWNWLILPKEGPLRVRFFTDSTVFCAEASVLVTTSTQPEVVLPGNVAPTTTPPPIVLLPRLTRSSSSSRRDDSGDNNGDNNGDNSADTALQAPDVNSLSSASTCPGDQLTIFGKGFGDERLEVDGEVVISGVGVSHYPSWEDGKIELLVPKTAALGAARDVYVITGGGFDRTTVDLIPASCGESPPAPTPPPTLTPSPTSPPRPDITSLSPMESCRGGRLTILGRGFGASQDEVDGQVVISGAAVGSYLSWGDRQVIVLVPNGAAPGTGLDLYLTTDGGFDQTTLNIKPGPC